MHIASRGLYTITVRFVFDLSGWSYSTYFNNDLSKLFWNRLIIFWLSMPTSMDSGLTFKCGWIMGSREDATTDFQTFLKLVIRCNEENREWWCLGVRSRCPLCTKPITSRISMPYFFTETCSHLNARLIEISSLRIKEHIVGNRHSWFSARFH